MNGGDLTAGKEKAPEGTVGVVPLGDMGEMAVRVITANLQGVLGLKVDLLRRRALTEAAYIPERRQFDASRLIQDMEEWASEYPHSRIVAVTSEDLCVPILRFVFGEAQVGGRFAVVSGHRLRRNEDGSEVSLDHYYERLVKVAIHEVGHTLALFHCEDSRCLMRFSPSVRHLDRLDLFFCDRCRFVLRRAVAELNAESAE